QTNGSFSYVPNAEFCGTDSFTFRVTDAVGISSTATVTITVSNDNEAAAPMLTASNAAGTEDTPIALNIAAALTDTDGSEFLSLTISGVPAGAVLNHGTQNQDGSWSLAPVDLDGLAITPAANSDADFQLMISAKSTESNGGDTTTTLGTIEVSVAADADAPTLNLSNASGAEDTAIPLNIQTGLTDIDGSESLSVTISGVPAGAVLNHGINNGNGVWTLSGGDLADLNITPPVNSDADFQLGVIVTSADTDTDTTSVTTASRRGTIEVTVLGVNDIPVAHDDNAMGGEDHILYVGAEDGLLANDFDVDIGDMLAVSLVNGQVIAVGQPIELSSGALLRVYPDGAYAYDPNGAYEFLNQGDIAIDSFTYSVTDNFGKSADASATVTILGADDQTVTLINGLTANYYTNTGSNGNFAIGTLYSTRIDTVIDFNQEWGGALPFPGSTNSNFAVRWTGFIEGPIDGYVTFLGRHDDGARLVIDDQTVFNNWRPQGPQNYNSLGSIYMEEGELYPFVLEMFENGGGDVMRLDWTYAGQPARVIHADYFFHVGIIPLTPQLPTLTASGVDAMPAVFAAFDGTPDTSAETQGLSSEITSHGSTATEIVLDEGKGGSVTIEDTVSADNEGSAAEKSAADPELSGESGIQTGDFDDVSVSFLSSETGVLVDLIHSETQVPSTDGLDTFLSGDQTLEGGMSNDGAAGDSIGVFLYPMEQNDELTAVMQSYDGTQAYGFSLASHMLSTASSDDVTINVNESGNKAVAEGGQTKLLELEAETDVLVFEPSPETVDQVAISCNDF
ncbi:MAG: PA14 domain-containing protein, partial [Lacipirellulaceae bacterium]